jgi:hypothetical protein
MKTRFGRKVCGAALAVWRFGCAGSEAELCCLQVTSHVKSDVEAWVPLERAARCC